MSGEAELWAAAAKMQADRDRCRFCPVWDGAECGGCDLDAEPPCRRCGHDHADEGCALCGCRWAASDAVASPEADT